MWSEDLCLPCWVPAAAERPHFSRFHQGIIISKNYKPLLVLHRKKSFSIFPSPAGMSITKLSLGGNNDVIYKLFPPRESLVSDLPAGNGNFEKLFLQCGGICFFTHLLDANIDKNCQTDTEGRLRQREGRSPLSLC